jgi:DNA repair exonuclease SbcCD ATPase subunit
MLCERMMKGACPAGHRWILPCHKAQQFVVCDVCERKKNSSEQDLIEQAKRNTVEDEHERKMAELNSQLAQEQRKHQDVRLAEERRLAIERKMKDLDDAVARKARVPDLKEKQANVSQQQLNSKSVAQDSVTTMPQPEPIEAPPRSAQHERWQRQKAIEGVTNEHIDEIMGMAGLEDVKRQVLDIKAKVDTASRQGTSVQDERFNVAMLGNPGTGECSHNY